jgi:hypothetical protein
MTRDTPQPSNPAELKPLRELYAAGKFHPLMRFRYIQQRAARGDFRTVKVAGVVCSTEEWVNEFFLRMMNAGSAGKAGCESDHKGGLK